MPLIKSDERVKLHKDKGVACQFCGLMFGRYKPNGGISPLKVHEYRCPKKKRHMEQFRATFCGCDLCVKQQAAEKEMRK